MGWMSALKLTGAPAAAPELDVPPALAADDATEVGAELTVLALAVGLLAALDVGVLAALVALVEAAVVAALVAAELVSAAVDAVPPLAVPPLAVPVAELPQALSANTSAIGKARRTSRMDRIGCLPPSTLDSAGECERPDRVRYTFAAADQHSLLQVKAPRTHAR